MKTPYKLFSEFDRNHNKIQDPEIPIQKKKKLVRANKLILKELDSLAGLNV